MKKLMLSLLFCTLTMTMSAGQISGKITVNGTVREYIGYLPSKLGTFRPLLISCHGMNQDAPYQRDMLRIESVADTAKFLTIFPQGIDKSWDISGDRDIKFVQAIIDEMEKKYKIDRYCVYLSGFSMGGMFTYHAMNRIADKIAAFAPISGYPMWGTTASASVRPIPIIHTHGTSDDVVAFSGVQGALNAWIAHNGCPTKAKVEKNYRGTPHITRRTWGPGKKGVEVVLMEMADKGHWISNDYGVMTGEEIWNFCKRYSLADKNPKVSFAGNATAMTFLSFGGKSEIPPVMIEASASDPDGQVANVSFYNGSTLLASFDEPPYTYELTELKKGTYNIRAVVTDNEGRTGTADMSIKVLEPSAASFYSLLQTVKQAENGIPEGWVTSDGQERRLEFAKNLTSGSRTLHFTNAKRDFEWGIFTSKAPGASQPAYLRFADAETKTTVKLNPGNYQLSYKVCNWNQPDFSPVTVAVETLDGQTVSTDTFTPTVNIGNNVGNAFSGSKYRNYQFEIWEGGNYVFSFYTADADGADFVLGQANLYYKGKLSAICSVADDTPVRVNYYNMSGQRLDCRPAKGCYIVQTISADGSKTARVVR